MIVLGHIVRWVQMYVIRDERDRLDDKGWWMGLNRVVENVVDAASEA